MTKEEHDMLQTAGKREWAEQPELIRNAFLFMWGMSDVITPLIETRKKFKLEIEYEPEQKTKYRITMDDESGQLPDRAQPCSSQVSASLL